MLLLRKPLKAGQLDFPDQLLTRIFYQESRQKAIGGNDLPRCHRPAASLCTRLLKPACSTRPAETGMFPAQTG